MPRLLKVNRNNGQLKYSRILQAAPSDIKFTLDGKHILVKGLGDIDIFNFNLDTILVSYFSQYYGDLVGDIKPLPNKINILIPEDNSRMFIILIIRIPLI